MSLIDGFLWNSTHTTPTSTLLREQVVEDGVLGSFDVEFEQVEPSVPELAHDRGQ